MRSKSTSSHHPLAIAAIAIIGIPVQIFLWGMLIGPWADVIENRQDGRLTVGRDAEFSRESMQLALSTREGFELVARGKGYDKIGDADVLAVNALIEKLNKALSENDDQQFVALVDQAAFRKRVFASDSVARLGNFVHYYAEWMTHYCPKYDRVQLVGIRQENELLVAHTLQYSHTECRRVSWYLSRSSSGQLLITDWLETHWLRLQSESIAREFAVAMTDSSGYDNYAKLKAAEFSNSKREARQQLMSFTRKRYPRLLKNEVVTYLAEIAYNYNFKPELMSILSMWEDESALTPGLLFLQAKQLVLRDDPKRAVDFLGKIEMFCGPGPRDSAFLSQSLTEAEFPDIVHNAQLDLLTLNCDLFTPYKMSLFPTDRANELVKIMKLRKDPASAALKLANQFVNLNRTDIANALVDFARNKTNTPDKSAHLLALEAKFSDNRGDIEQAIKQYQTAWSKADEDSDREQWIYAWSSLLEELDRGEEAIQNAPDPLSVFCDLTFDEGYLYVESDVAQRYVTALQNASVRAADRQIKDLLISAGLAAIAIENRDFSKAYALAGKVYASRIDDEKITEKYFEVSYINESVLDWLVEAGVATGKTTDVFQFLVANDEPLSALFYSCNGEANNTPPNPQPLQEFVDLFQKHDPESEFCKYYAASLMAVSPDQLKQARAEFLTLAQLSDAGSPDQEQVASQALSWLANDAIEHQTISRLAREISMDRLFPLLNNRLFYQDIEQIPDLLQLASESGKIPSDELLPVQLRYFKNQRNWPQIVKLYTRHRNYFAEDIRLLETSIDAYIATGNLKGAESIIRQNEVDEFWNKLYVARSQPDELLKRVKDESQMAALENDPVIWKRLQSEKFAELRKKFPRRFSVSGRGKTITVLLTEPMTTNASALAALPAIKKARGIVLPIPQIPETKQQRFRIDFAEVSFLLETSDDVYDSPIDGGEPDRSTLPTEWINRLKNHRGWIRISTSWNAPTIMPRDIDQLAARLTADLFENTSPSTFLAIQAAYGFVPHSDEMIKKLRTGKLPSYSDLYLTQALPETNYRKQQRRRNALVALIAGSPFHPEINIKIRCGGQSLTLPLVDWSPNARPNRFLVDLPDSPVVPTALRNTRVALSTYQIEDWSMSDR